MKKAYIDPDLCDRSPGCPAARVCSTRAITREHFFAPSVVNQDACIGCTKCTRYCPAGAISMIEATEDRRQVN